MSTPTQFAPNKSFVDASFFSEFGKHKLETAKLSEQSVPIYGTMDIPVAPNRGPILRISQDSLDPASPKVAAPFEFAINGTITNLNTIDAFKAIDKAQLLQNAVSKLDKSIKSRAIFADLSQLLRFHVISFSDLKKYKYYYWFVFPAFGWSSTANKSGPADLTLNKAIESWRIAQKPADQLFFALQNNEPAKLDAKSDAAGTKLGAEPLDRPTFGMIDFSSDEGLPWQLRNYAVLLASMGYRKVRVYVYRDHANVQVTEGRSYWLDLDLAGTPVDIKSAVGWERNRGKLSPKVSDLAALANPLALAEQAVDLNLKLMKWRAAPSIDLDVVRNTKCLLLGAGTLGAYVARGLMAWGVREITFVDNGKVSYSNPVRQPLYTLKHCIEGAAKAEAAARSLQEIFPGVIAKGLSLNVPMAGHPVTNQEREKAEYETLLAEIEANDAIFLLMDSRESRWLPTVIGSALGKIVINVAIGFDSYLVMRHGVPPENPVRYSGGISEAPETCAENEQQLGCYYCNDVVAPIDSISRLTLDQMCTVTRPGVAQLASGHAVELLATVLQHPDRAHASPKSETVLGPVVHQLRGFVQKHETLNLWGPAFPSCSGCGTAIIEAWKADGWAFVQQALGDSDFVTELSGLGALQRTTGELDFDEQDDDDEIV